MTERAITAIVALDSIAVPAKRLRQLRPEKVSELAESIRKLGLINPISLQQCGHRQYMLVAGRHRFEAVKQIGQTTTSAIILNYGSADQVALAELDENLIRADLSPAEHALHLGERERLYEKMHPDTVSIRVRGGPGRGNKNQSQNATGLSFIDDTAERTSKHRATIARSVARAANIPALADVIGTTPDAGDQLDSLAKLPEELQRQLINRAKAGERIDVKVAVMKERRIRREHELAEGTKAASGALGKKLYGVIYADPPWRYDNPPMGDVARHNEQHYPSMALSDIKALAIPAADNCVLFLWATVPLLPEAIELMRAWGFTYKSSSTWVKDKAGTGYWVRGIVEHLLIGRRGDVPAPAPGDQFPGVIEAPRGRHSEKPDVFAEHIQRLFPNVPKLEMFAREARPGWDVWGNEAVEAAE